MPVAGGGAGLVPVAGTCDVRYCGLAYCRARSRTPQSFITVVCTELDVHTTLHNVNEQPGQAIQEARRGMLDELCRTVTTRMCHVVFLARHRGPCRAVGRISIRISCGFTGLVSPTLGQCIACAPPSTSVFTSSAMRFYVPTDCRLTRAG